ncbi:alpha/beta hydrolase family protein [Caulobacter vibrioides]|nr:prolyl oligopeptidase family serine peptidase [Caulobacter vibrioides]
MVEDVQISPDGSKLAVITTDGEKRFLTIRKTEGGGLAGISVGDNKLRSASWAGEDHVILVSSVATQGLQLAGPKREYFTVVDFNIVSGVQKPLMEAAPEALTMILGQPQIRTIKGDPHVFLEGARFLRGAAANTLFRFNLRTGTIRMLEHGARYSSDSWLVDAEGQPLAQSTYDHTTGRWSLLMKAGSTWRTVDTALAPMGSHGVSGLGRDGTSAVVWRRGEDVALKEYRADGASEMLVEDSDLKGLLHDPETQRLIGSYGMRGDDIVYAFNKTTDQAFWRAALKAFPDDRVTLQSWTKDRKRLVVKVDSPTKGPAFAIVDFDTKQSWTLGPIYKNLTADAISPVRAISYKAADGLAINAYLTLPRTRAPRNLPLIVLPHAGPEGRDTLGYDWWSQALASRGYAVLRANFRGSDGLGVDFLAAGFGQWGKTMQTDLSDGVRHLADQGLIDRNRVCIMGASYGGYAALAGAALDTGVYRCAVSVGGPTDLNLVVQSVLKPEAVCVAEGPGSGARSAVGDCRLRGAGPLNIRRLLVTNADGRDLRTSTSPRYWLRFMGFDGSRTPDLDAISPAKLADKVSVPVLLIHGTDDTIVPYAHSQIMADALKRAGKPVDLIPLDGEDHWLSRGATRLKMLTEAVAFVEKHNPPD